MTEHEAAAKAAARAAALALRSRGVDWRVIQRVESAVVAETMDALAGPLFGDHASDLLGLARSDAA